MTFISFAKVPKSPPYFKCPPPSPKERNIISLPIHLFQIAPNHKIKIQLPNFTLVI